MGLPPNIFPLKQKRIYKMKSILFAVPFLNEAENLKKFPERIREIRQSIQARCLFLFIDDGSTDESLEIVKSWKEKDISLISFSKNYGSHIALFAAIEHADTDYFTFMRSDMQEPVSLYSDLFLTAEKSRSEIVLAEREVRETDRSNRLFSKIYNALVKKLAFPDYPPNGVDIVFLNRTVIDAMKTVQEKNTSFYGVLFTLGFKKKFVPYKQLPRKIGKSKWTLRKKIKLLADTFISFTVFPLRLLTYSGILIFTGGASYGLFLIINTLVNGVAAPGWATIVIFLSMGFGLNFLFLGIISEYLWRMFDQIRDRPRYVIREKIGFKSTTNKKTN